MEVMWVKRYGYLVILVLLCLCILTGCEAYDYTDTETASNGSWMEMLHSNDIMELVSLEQSYLCGDAENPWLSGSVGSLFNNTGLTELLELYREEVVGSADENESNTHRVLTTEERKYIVSYINYDMFSYDKMFTETFSDDVVKPFSFTHALNTSYVNKNIGLVLSEWDRNKHYLFGVACGFKSKCIWNQAVKSLIVVGDIIIKPFSAEEIADYMPVNMSFEEQSEFIRENLFFVSGVRVSNNLFKLYDYVYKSCDYTFVLENDEIVDLSDDNSYSFVIDNIDKDNREVLIHFVEKGTQDM